MFEDHLPVLFRMGGVAATLQPAAGGSQTVRLIQTSPETDFQAFETGAYLPDMTGEISVAEVAALVDGDELVVGAKTYLVRSPKLRANGLIWGFGMQEVL